MRLNNIPDDYARFSAQQITKKNKPSPNKSFTSAIPPTGSFARLNCISQETFDEISHYDTLGPGIVGHINDLVANSVGRLTPKVRVRFAGSDGWQFLDDEQKLQRAGVSSDRILSIKEAADITLMKYDLGEQPLNSLFQRASRLLLTRGECWIYRPDEFSYNVISPVEIENNSNGFIWKERKPNGTVDDTVVKIPVNASDTIKKGFAWRLWRPDPDFAQLPWTQWSRVLVHIREYISAKYRQQADAESAMMRDLLFIPESYNDPNTPEEQDSGVAEIVGYLSKVYDSKVTQRYGVKRSNGDSGPVLLFKPNPDFNGDPGEPSLMSLLRTIDSSAFTLEEKALTAIGQSFGISSQFLETGGINSKFASVDFLEQSLLDKAVDPIAFIVYKGWSQMDFNPRMRLILGESFDDYQFELFYDTKELLPRRNRGEELYRAWRAGAIGSDEIARELGIDPMVLPDDMTYFDQWLIGINGARDVGAGEPDTGVSDTRTASFGMAAYAVFNELHREVLRRWGRGVNKVVTNREEKQKINQSTLNSGLQRTWISLANNQRDLLAKSGFGLFSLVDLALEDKERLVDISRPLTDNPHAIVDFVVDKYRGWFDLGIEPTFSLMAEEVANVEF